MRLHERHDQPVRLLGFELWQAIPPQLSAFGTTDLAELKPQQMVGARVLGRWMDDLEQHWRNLTADYYWRFCVFYILRLADPGNRLSSTTHFSQQQFSFFLEKSL